MKSQLLCNVDVIRGQAYIKDKNISAEAFNICCLGISNIKVMNDLCH